MATLAALVAADAQAPLRSRTGAYYLVDYHLAGDGSDWLPSWDRFQATVGLTAAHIVLPAQDLNFSGVMNIWRHLRVSGSHMGFQPSTGGTRLIFPANTTGIHVWTGDETGTDPVYSGPVDGSGTLTMLENLTIVGGGLTGTGLGHGIWMGALVWGRHLNVQGFAGHGVYCNAFARVPFGLGNANLWAFSECEIRSNGLDGFHVENQDANAGLASMIYGGNNGGWDFYDGSSLGNTYIACHSDGGGKGSFKSEGNTNVYVGCYNESKAMSLFSGDIVVGGTLATQYFTGQVSYQSPRLTVVGGSPGSGAQVVVNGVDGTTGAVTSVLPTDFGSDYVGSPTVTVDKEGDGTGLVLTPVVTGGQIKSYTITNAGTGYRGVGGNVAYIGSTTRGGLSTSEVLSHNFFAGSRYIQAALNYAANQIFTARIFDNANNNNFEEFDLLAWHAASASYQSANNNNVALRYVGKYSTTETGGRASVLPAGSVEAVNGLWLGSGSAGRQMTNGTAAPSTGQWARGDIIYNTAPTSGGFVGWVCVTTGDFAGTPPVFKTFGVIS